MLAALCCWLSREVPADEILRRDGLWLVASSGQSTEVSVGGDGSVRVGGDGIVGELIVVGSGGNGAEAKGGRDEVDGATCCMCQFNEAQQLGSADDTHFPSRDLG